MSANSCSDGRGLERTFARELSAGIGGSGVKFPSTFSFVDTTACDCAFSPSAAVELRRGSDAASGAMAVDGPRSLAGTRMKAFVKTLISPRGGQGPRSIDRH